MIFIIIVSLSMSLCVMSEAKDYVVLFLLIVLRLTLGAV